jgi:hypothetical protein
LHNLLASALLVLTVLAVPNTDSADCGNLADRYSASVTAVAEALRAYGRCIATSDERDNCAAEMQALDNAHDNFADAVADAKDCR